MHGGNPCTSPVIGFVAAVSVLGHNRNLNFLGVLFQGLSLVDFFKAMMPVGYTPWWAS